MRFCAVPTCAAVVPKGRCTQHQREAERTRGTSTQRGYDTDWARYSLNFRANHPICGMRADNTMDATHSRCVQQGRTTPAQCVDHIVPMSKGGSKWDEANHLSLCLACNTAKGDRT